MVRDAGGYLCERVDPVLHGVTGRRTGLVAGDGSFELGLGGLELGVSSCLDC